MASALLDYGKRVQESVFMAHLDEELHGRMVERVKQGSLEGTADLHNSVRRVAEPYFHGQFDAQKWEQGGQVPRAGGDAAYVSGKFRR